MKIWSQTLCRWILWHGTRKVWLALPTAVVISSACLPASHGNAMLTGLPWLHNNAVTKPVAKPAAPIPNIAVAIYQPPAMLPVVFPGEVFAPIQQITTRSTQLADAPTSVPEPSSFALLMGALVALLFILGLGRPRILRSASDTSHITPPDWQIDLFAATLISIEVGWLIILWRFAERLL
jgi:hypothetical protein